MRFDFAGGGVLLLLLPIIWWVVVIYFVLRFLQAFERGVRAHEDIARELRRRSDSQKSRDGTGGIA